MNNAYFIPYSVNNGKFNMKKDEQILSYAIKRSLNAPILRLYGWKPYCISLGRNQTGDKINREYCYMNGIDIVKRLTGGRALLHDKELTYSFVTPIEFLQEGSSVMSSYKEISGAVVEGLKLTGIETEFPANKKASTNFEYCMSLCTGADLSYNGMKLVGSAQFRKHGYILQHGSILIDFDSKKIENIFGEKPNEQKIISLSKIKPAFDFDNLCDNIKSGFENYFNLKFEEFKPSHLH